MSGPAQAGIDTASNRKDAVRKAFNQEYMATQEAMTQAAERARAQVLDQRYTISAHADSVKAGTQAPLGAPNRGGANPAAQPHAQPQTQPPAQGAPYMNAHPAAGAANQVMFDIANELRNIINQEIEQRMQVLAARVEEAILQSLPRDDETNETAESQDGAAGSDGGANAGANGHANVDANGNVNGNANTHVKGGGA
ncbi:hypothetical protein [Thalassospira lucentensis]|uniref:hypothetical protein n=1 Tax=Thalassospira lucentensis TaxID=168935 RepID=UPI00142DD65E|nr:hypothetical protein [Thalassospira lucentensis]NIZ03285.1 hypothetical protein [Thalassospira lucentensis]